MKVSVHILIIAVKAMLRHTESKYSEGHDLGKPHRKPLNDCADIVIQHCAFGKQWHFFYSLNEKKCRHFGCFWNSGHQKFTLFVVPFSKTASKFNPTAAFVSWTQPILHTYTCNDLYLNTIWLCSCCLCCVDWVSDWLFGQSTTSCSQLQINV